MCKKAVKFSNELTFKGMTINNREVFLAIAESSKNTRCVLTFKMIGDIAGVTKQTAKNNVRKLEGLGIIRCSNQYRFNDKMPYNYTINTKWVEQC